MRNDDENFEPLIFEWDEDKNQLNISQHQLSFEDVKGVFFDPFCLRKIDQRFDYDGEERWQALGSVNGITVILVAYTHRDRDNIEVIRLISARKASAMEKKTYDNGKTNYF